MRIALFAVCLGSALATLFAAHPFGEHFNWRLSFDPWRTDAVWYDGLAEKCVYKATRTIYSKPRSYEAVAYTDKEKLDPKTTVKSKDDDGLETFKHHWSEIIPTDNYAYRFSTCVHTEVANLQTAKLTVSTQEDCGASFKLLTKNGSSFEWFDSVYFPDGGQRNGTIPAAFEIHFADELPLLLRDYEFAHPADRALKIVASQRDTHQVDWTPFEIRVSYAGKETLDLPIGKLETHHLTARATHGPWTSEYWFAADGAAPRLHVLAKFLGPEGQTYELASQERTAYWKH